MGLQVSHCFHTEASQEGSIWCTAATFGGDVSRVSLAQGVKDCGGAHDGRSRSHVLEHSAEVCGIKCRGIFKGKSAIQSARKLGGRQKNFTGEHFWARGYFVSTVGLDENMVRAYIRNQEEEDERYDQMKLVMG
jgi:putative transposase